VNIIGLYYVQSYDSDFDGPFDMQALRNDVSSMLARTGNPYQFNILDLDRTLALDLGVSGAPETFLVNSEGVILLHHTGDINPRVWRAKFAPLMQELTP
ncbi:MAG: thiol:disulfide interchange protein, partial [Pseudoalteromonas sp.]